MELCCFLLTRQVYSQKGLLCRSSHEVLTKMAGSVARDKTSSSCIIFFPVYLKRIIFANVCFQKSWSGGNGSELRAVSNLIGSLSRTIQQYSPPSEWIMCELGVFSIFLENHLLKVDKILALTFF